MLQQSPLECIICQDGPSQESFLCCMPCCGQVAHIHCLIRSFNTQIDKVGQAGHPLSEALRCVYCRQPWISLASHQNSSAKLELGLVALLYFTRFGGVSFDAIQAWLQSLSPALQSRLRKIFEQSRSIELTVGSIATITSNLRALGYKFSPNASVRASREPLNRLIKVLRQHACFAEIPRFLNQGQRPPPLDLPSDVFALVRQIACNFRSYDADFLNTPATFNRYKVALTNPDEPPPIPVSALVPALDFSKRVRGVRADEGLFDIFDIRFDIRVPPLLLILIIFVLWTFYLALYDCTPAPSTLWVFGQSIFLFMTTLRIIRADLTIKDVLVVMLVSMLINLIGYLYSSM